MKITFDDMTIISKLNWSAYIPSLFAVSLPPPLPPPPSPHIHTPNPLFPTPRPFTPIPINF